MSDMREIKNWKLQRIVDDGPGGNGALGWLIIACWLACLPLAAVGYLLISPERLMAMALGAHHDRRMDRYDKAAAELWRRREGKKP